MPEDDLYATLLQKARDRDAKATIGPPKLGDTYLPPEGNWKIPDVIRYIMGMKEVPRSLLKQDPYGIETWAKHKGPMPMFAATTIGPKAVPFDDYHGYLRKVATDSFKELFKEIPEKHPDPSTFMRYDPLGETLLDYTQRRKTINNMSTGADNILKYGNEAVREYNERGLGETNSDWSKDLIDMLADMYTRGHKTSWYK